MSSSILQVIWRWHTTCLRLDLSLLGALLQPELIVWSSSLLPLHCSAAPTPPLAFLGVTISTGVAGGIMFTAAHELLHGSSWVDRMGANLLLATVGYMHWGESHLAHHVKAGLGSGSSAVGGLASCAGACCWLSVALSLGREGSAGWPRTLCLSEVTAPLPHLPPCTAAAGGHARRPCLCPEGGEPVRLHPSQRVGQPCGRVLRRGKAPGAAGHPPAQPPAEQVGVSQAGVAWRPGVQVS